MSILKHAFLGLSMALCLSASAFATTIAGWTFETSIPPTGVANGTFTGTTVSGIVPEVGAGSGSGVHALATSVYSNPSGNGSVESFSSNGWSTGDYYQFQVSTTGLEDIIFSWNQTRSGTGPASFDLQYSTDGSSFTTFTSYTVPQVSWASGAPEASGTSVFTQNLSAIAGIENVPAVYFRLTSTVTTAAGGTNRVDNIFIEGTPTIPEPSSIALVFASVGAMLFRRK